MDATAREPSGELLAETLAHRPTPAPGSLTPAGARPPESHPMTQIATPPPGTHRYTFASGARPLEGYTIKRAIGRGGFGEVYYATSDAGKEVALKLITRNLEVERRGVAQCMNLKSQNLITIFDIRECEAGDTFVIMEYVAGPSLAEVLACHPDGLPPAEVRAWLKGLVDGVAYLHDHGIVHRDLKPANVFLEEGVVKIGDYGLSKAMSQTQGPEHSECIGTCYYMAPEVSTGKYNRPIDIYALGVMLFEMITGRPPFEGESAHEVLFKHLTALPDLSPLGEPYRGIVARALAKDPKYRPAHAFELLPAADAPGAPDVRIIGDGRSSAGGIRFVEERPKREEVVFLDAEPAPFFIGENTWPTRRRDSTPPAPPRPERRPPTPPPTPPPAPPRPVVAAPPRPVAAARPVPAPRPVAAPPPVPPPLPSGRVRVAELATSMILATPLAALLTLPAGMALDNWVDPARLLPQLASLFGLALLSTWVVLGLGKLWEGEPVSWPVRRLTALGSGFVLGLATLAVVVLLDPPLGRWIGPDGPNLYVYGSYFALTTMALTWGNLTGRDRPARFRVRPVLTAGIVGLGLATLLPLPRAAGLPPTTFWPMPHGLAVVVMTSVLAQLVSPRQPAAAAYARYRRDSRRQVA